jgi:hypothetical protein
MVSVIRADRAKNDGDKYPAAAGPATEILLDAIRAGHPDAPAKHVRVGFCQPPELAARGYLNERGKPFNPKSVSVLLAS